MPNRLRKFRDLLEKGKCAICMDFIKPAQGQLSCFHQQFCFDCISSWANISNKCPLCKQVFSSITNLSTSESFPIAAQETEADDSIFDSIICELCELGTSEDALLLCDLCDRGFHTHCIGIARVPYLEQWFCVQCIKAQPENVQERQRIEIMLAREIELPVKRSRRNCRKDGRREVKLRRSERLKNIN
jgi:hypothetical protein